MDPKLIVDLLRLLVGISGAIRTFTETASAEQLKAFVDEVHASGGTVDLAAVDRALDQARQSGADLDAKIKAAGG